VYTNGKIIYINKQGVKLAGAKSVDEGISNDIMKFVHPDFQKIIGERESKAMQYNVFEPVMREKTH